MTRTVSTCFALGLLLAAALAPAAAGAAAPELPEASFVRMLTHTPYAGPTAHTAPVGVDPLQLALVLPLRDGHRAATPESPEASFARMLTHTPYAGPTAHTAPVGVDPLQLALVLPLRDGQGAAVAQAKPAAATGCPNARAPQR